jgi:integrase
VRGPDRGAKTGKQWRYPDEVTALLGCGEVPLRWRRLYALPVDLYVRPGEHAALEWKDVDVERSFVHVHQALDVRTGLVKATKTGITRRVPIQP